jgi:hypothetical protein
MSNFPPPSGKADEIIAVAIELLAADEWEQLEEGYVVIRSVFIVKETASIRIAADGSDVLRWGRPSAPYRDAFKEAFNSAVEREREKRLGPVLARIGDAGRAAREARTRGLVRVLWVFGVVVALSLMGFGVTSCVNDMEARAAAERARDGEVNAYGYKRGNIPSRYVWPDDCMTRGGIQFNNDPSTSRDFHSVYECRDSWKRWERDGEVWVDWKAE